MTKSHIANYRLLLQHVKDEAQSLSEQDSFDIYFQKHLGEALRILDLAEGNINRRLYNYVG